jgi:LacI family transcriptional regulator
MAGSPNVCVDDARGSAVLVEHLLRDGRQRIALLAGPQNSHSGRERERGFAEGLALARKQADADLIVRCDSPDVDGGCRAAHLLLATRPDVDAIICYNDLVAIGALRACSQLGRQVPGDVAVTGADDILLARLVTPALTTLRSDRQAIGAAALRILLDKLNGVSTGSSRLVFEPQLVVRASAP